MDTGAVTMTTMATTSSDIQALEARHVLQTYKRQPVVFVRGDGSRIEDVDGRRYLDFVSGIGVSGIWIGGRRGAACAGASRGASVVVGATTGAR